MPEADIVKMSADVLDANSVVDMSEKDSRHRNGLGDALKKMSRICRFWSLWFDVTVEPGLIQLRTEPKRRNDDALHGDS